VGLFVGVFPEKEILDHFRDIKRQFTKQKRNLKLVPNDHIHITLRYIGRDVSDNHREIIRQTLKANEGEFGKIEFNLDKVQWGFPKEHFPKFLLVDVENTKALKETADRFHYLIKDLAFKDTILWKNKWANDFHITLARLKKTASRSTSKLIGSNVKNKFEGKFQPLKFTATEAWLVESYTVDGQVKYDKLEKIIL
jgi:2'-5' RNA ligase